MEVFLPKRSCIQKPLLDVFMVRAGVQKKQNGSLCPLYIKLDHHHAKHTSLLSICYSGLQGTISNKDVE